MAQRRSLAWTELRVGLLVIASFALLAVAIFYVSGQSGIFTKKYTVTAFFASANGLRSGAEVWLEGVTIGNVDQVRISKQADPMRSVEVDLKVDESYRNIIRTDSTVTIGTIGLLGDKYIDITRGTESGQVIPDGGTLQGTEAGDIRKIVTGTSDFVANLDSLSTEVRKLADRVDRGEGTLGKFMTDTSVFDNANSTMKEANAFVRDLRSGNGTVAKLVSDDEAYNRVNELMDRVAALIDKLENGPGTSGKFINDPAVYNKADKVLARVESVADRIDRGEGTIGKLTKDEVMYNELRDSVTRFSTLVTSIQNGEGSAGKFIRDPTLYNTMNESASEIQKLLYDFRQNPKKFLTINFRLF
jgi:phospholipid/cholesterol/gamma-HCH transport system substrate-binding protein